MLYFWLVRKVHMKYIRYRFFFIVVLNQLLGNFTITSFIILFIIFNGHVRYGVSVVKDRDSLAGVAGRSA